MGNCGQGSGIQKSHVSEEHVIENIGKLDDQYTAMDSVEQFYSSLHQNNQMSTYDSRVSNNNTGMQYDYYHAGYNNDVYNNNNLLPSYDVTPYSTNQNTNISSENYNMCELYALDDTQFQDAGQFSRSDARENMLDTNSVIVDNGKVYATLSNVKSDVDGDTNASGSDAQEYNEVTDVKGYADMTEDVLINPDHDAQSSMLCRIVNSFSLAK